MDSTFFTANRERLLETVGSGALIVLTAYREMQRSNDAAFLFEQEANFLYLSGITAPDWWLIIDGRRRRSYAVAPTVSDTKQVFDGSLPPDDARQISGVDEVIDRDEADALLLRLAREHRLVYTANESTQLKRYVSFGLNPAQRELTEYLKHRFQDVRGIELELARQRAIKQRVEVAAVQEAINITIGGFRAMRDDLERYRYEYEAEARLGYEFRRVGADGQAYNPIVGAGEHACTLHYVANNAKLVKRSFLLIDAGAKYAGYSADITRTYSVGKPTERMRHIYEAVQYIQTELIGQCRPGLSLAELQKNAEALTETALNDLRLLGPGKTVQDYFPHAISHGLGIDVHDSLGDYKELQSGMVITIEPGIYIPEESLGVRIEDDILITDTGHRNLSGTLSTDL